MRKNVAIKITGRRLHEEAIGRRRYPPSFGFWQICEAIDLTRLAPERSPLPLIASWLRIRCRLLGPASSCQMKKCSSLTRGTFPKTPSLERDSSTSDISISSSPAGAMLRDDLTFFGRRFLVLEWKDIYETMVRGQHGTVVSVFAFAVAVRRTHDCRRRFRRVILRLLQQIPHFTREGWALSKLHGVLSSKACP